MARYPPPVDVFVRSTGLKSSPVSNQEVRNRAERMLIALHRPNAELSILLCDDETIHQLNRDFRAIDRPTDVLAFAMQEQLEGVPEAKMASNDVLGDIVISLHTARRQAASGRKTIVSEVTFLLAHGLLHLLGFDHRDAAELRRMMAMTDALVAAARPRRAVDNS